MKILRDTRPFGQALFELLAHDRPLSLQPPTEPHPRETSRRNDAEREESSGLNERRNDREPEHCPVVIPQTVVVAGDHVKGIAARRKIGVGGRPGH